MAGIIPKINKLKKVKTRKIVIIGGSNASFGIDSDLMERQLGIPVVNMALHGGLPLYYLLEQVKPFMNKGDILILSREYDGLVGDNRWAHMTGTELPKIITYDLSGLSTLLSSRTFFETTTSSLFNTLKLYIKRYPMKAQKDTTSVYSSRAFKNDNIFSDFLQGKYGSDIEEHPLPKPGINSLIIDGLRKNLQYFRNKGINFYLTPPVIVKGYYKEEDMKSFWEFISEGTKIPMLNEKKMYSYNKSYFLNSHYHNNATGRRIRTISIIDDINNKKLLKLKYHNFKSIYVSNKEILSNASLMDFNSLHNFKIIRRDNNEIEIIQNGSLEHNYFRIKFDLKDYKGYNFYIQLECNKDVIDQIRFRGTGALMKFDTIIPLGNNNYGAWKKMEKVLWTDNNSYLGISFPNNEILKDARFKVKNVGVYKYIGKDDLFVNEYLLSFNNKTPIFFEVKSKNTYVKLMDIIDSEDIKANIKLEANLLYKMEYADNKIRLKDFYSGKILYETKKEIRFKKSDSDLVHIYE
ncbi:MULTISPECIES: hypothetical protein [Arenibacter]|uniref:hypothetical protein n=1 Tax=Arenibacter TaxID=178469 RepID=UPI00130002D9|nr:MULTISPECIES: hypothetical protein [Arenibacter]